MQFKIPVRFGNKASTDKNDSTASKIGTSLFFLFFAGMGSGFIVLMIREVIRGKTEATILFFLIIPLIFVLIGIGGLWGTWFGKAKDKEHGPKAKHASRTLGKRGVLVIGIIIAAAGLVASYILLIHPLLKSLQARSWSETPCKIISAAVGEHHDDDGTTYSIDITYEYVIDGRTVRCDRYDFIGGSSSGYHGKKEVADRYRQAANPVCYVNPKDPSEAVLVRDLTARNAIGLFPLIFVAAGVAVSATAIRRKNADGGPAWLPAMKRVETEQAENEYAFLRDPFETPQDAITLNPDATPLGKLAVVLGVCLFWNGIVSVFIYQAVQSFRAGRPEWGLTLFLIPFVLIGAAIAGGVVYQFLALFNPRFTLTLRPGMLYPGTAIEFDWRGTGKTGRIRKLDITLTGREEATYQVGTNTRTAKHTFFSLDLFSTERFDEINNGRIGFAIPEDTMHSFEANNNKIIWSINIHGDIARWPDVKHEYKLAIRPLPVNLEEQP